MTDNTNEIPQPPKVQLPARAARVLRAAKCDARNIKASFTPAVAGSHKPATLIIGDGAGIAQLKLNGQAARALHTMLTNAGYGA